MTVLYSKRGLTANEILHAVPRIVRKRAESVKVYSIKVRITDFGVEYYAKTRTVGENASGNTYVTSVTLLDPRTRRVFIDCTCPYHPYWGAEYNLNKKNAARIIRSNGKSPRIRDPLHRNLACKHAVALLRELIKQRRV